MIVIVMGVSGSGKSTVGALLARRLAAGFIEGDDFHPRRNIEKMRSGRALDDQDRLPWLRALADELDRAQQADRSVVLSCSALKQAYRDRLMARVPRPVLVHLSGDRELIAERLRRRQGHFFPVRLLDEQWRDLEPPRDAITLDVRSGPEELVEAICRALPGGSRGPRASS